MRSRNSYLIYLMLTKSRTAYAINRLGETIKSGQHRLQPLAGVLVERYQVCVIPSKHRYIITGAITSRVLSMLNDSLHVAVVGGNDRENWHQALEPQSSKQYHQTMLEYSKWG